MRTQTTDGFLRAHHAVLAVVLVLVLGLHPSLATAAPAGASAGSRATNELSLRVSAPQADCVPVGDAVTVTMSMCCLQQLVVSYQAFLEFDSAVLSYEQGAYVLPDPFGLPTIPVTVNGNAIDLAAGVNVFIGQPPTQADADLAVFTFRAIGAGDATVRFRTHSPPTRMSVYGGGAVTPTLRNTDVINVRVSCAPVACVGDANCDQVISWRDIDYFVAGMNDGESAWRERFLPGTPGCPFSNLDTNGDSHVSWRDIDSFVALMNTTCN